MLRPQPQTAGEIEMAEDFDELTQSSDTATSDLEDPTSGYRHASFLIKQLDSATLGTHGPKSTTLTKSFL